MKQKQSRQHIPYWWGLVLLGPLLVITYFFSLPREQQKVTFEYPPVTSLPIPTVDTSERMYTSPYVKITIRIPEGYTAKEVFNGILLTNSKGTILIDRIGTNFDTLEGYVDNLSELNRVSIGDRKYVKINGFNSMRVTIKHPESQLPDNYTYFIYPGDFWVMSIGTDSIDLLQDLDSIAQSFQHKPEKR